MQAVIKSFFICETGLGELRENQGSIEPRLLRRKKDTIAEPTITKWL
jgi:hypothetical protein